MKSNRPFTAATAKKLCAAPVRHTTSLVTYTVTENGKPVFTGTIGKIREFLGMNRKSQKDAVKYRLEQGITEKSKLLAPTMTARESWRFK